MKSLILLDLENRSLLYQNGFSKMKLCIYRITHFYHFSAIIDRFKQKRNCKIYLYL